MKLIAIIALFLFACVHLPHVDPALRNDQAEAKAAMLVQVVCADMFGTGDTFPKSFDLEDRYGTAVLIDERHALTAYHLVHCPFGQTSVRGTLAGGRRVMLQVDREDADADIARLTIATANNFEAFVPPPILGDVKATDTVCSATAYPKREWHCGQVGEISPRPAGNIRGWWEAVPGNSGAGLYLDGKLVGIVVEHRWCGVPGKSESCGGNATSINGRHPDWFAK